MSKLTGSEKLAVRVTVFTGNRQKSPGVVLRAWNIRRSDWHRGFTLSVLNFYNLSLQNFALFVKNNKFFLVIVFMHPDDIYQGVIKGKNN